MTLTNFVARADVKGKLKGFRPPPPRKIGVPIRIPHRATKDHVTSIGTAFDYLVRFELERRAPQLANTRKNWVAENATRRIKVADLSGGNAAEVERQIGATLSNSRDIWKAYLCNKDPSRADLEIVATYAMKLAKIDPLIRRQKLSRDYNEVDSESVGELLDLFAIVPWHEFVRSEMLLNPNFPASSHVGGADGDLVTGDMLVDFKTVSRDDHDIEVFDQLLGYYLLANHFPGHERDLIVFPKINRVAIYYSRHGSLWSLNTSFWTDQGGFPELKEWFFSRAKEVFASRPVLQGRNQQGEDVIIANCADLTKPKKKRRKPKATSKPKRKQ